MKYIAILIMSILLWIIAIGIVQVKLIHPKWSFYEIAHYTIYNK